MTQFVPLTRVECAGTLWHAMWTNGDVEYARTSNARRQEIQVKSFDHLVRMTLSWPRWRPLSFLVRFLIKEDV